MVDQESPNSATVVVPKRQTVRLKIAAVISRINACAQFIVPKPETFRWKIAALILFVGACVQFICWKIWTDDLTNQMFSVMYILPSVLLLLLLWWSLLSGLQWRTRGIGLLICGGIVGGFFSVFRIVGDGALVPRIVWRRGGEAPKWNDGQVGERSETSFALQKRLEAETKKNRQTKQQLIVDEWETVEVIALGFGCAIDAFCSSNSAALIRRPALLQRARTASYWPSFRGPFSDSVIRDKPIRMNFSKENPPVNRWKTGQRVGQSWSSFAVVDGLALTLEQRDEKETTVCYDFANGSQIWTQHDEVHYEGDIDGNGPRSTPTVVGRRLYTLGATGILNCRDLLHSGKLIWTHNILDDANADNLAWGLSGSPVVAGNLVFVNAGKNRDKNGDGKSVIAYNRFTGEIEWAVGNKSASYATPLLAEIHGVQQLLVFNGDGLFSYNPSTGKKLWNYDWSNGPKVNASQPIVRGNKIFISSGYNTGSALLEVSVDHHGQWSVGDVWVKKNHFRLKFNDAIYKDGYVYGLDETILTCIDFKTGQRKWRMRGKFGYGQLLLIGETLLISAESGAVHLFPATPKKPKQIAEFQALNRDAGFLEEKGTGWNHPVIVNGYLLIRNNREAACYDLRKIDSDDKR